MTPKPKIPRDRMTAGQKAAETNRRKYGADYYKKISVKGGQNGTGHTFGHGRVDPAEAGRKGGAISKRRPKGAKV